VAANFIILIGGPGTYEACDADHDKTWLNYVFPVQMAAAKDLYNRGRDHVHWVVYERAYHVRWLDDSEITLLEGLRETISGRALHKVRKAAADKVKNKGALNYVDRIKKIAHEFAITYKGINSPKEFWDYLAAFPPASIGRIWYSGHATPNGLILELTHNSRCVASWTDASTVLTADIAAQGRLKDRFIASSSSPSKFYGCKTAGFARQWHETFGVPTEGAERSISFAKIVEDGKQVLHGLETNPTPEGTPGWTRF
jgi:hypothetical protein